MKQLHSESQRLIRGQLELSSTIDWSFFLGFATKLLNILLLCVESMCGLPYHVPEPKSIDQFFKKRARPVGSAMELIK